MIGRLKIVLFGLFALLIGVSLIYVGYLLRKSNSNSILTPTQIPKQQSIISIPIQKGTNEWKIYRNKEYSFEIKYPPYWGISDNLYDFHAKKPSSNPYIALFPEESYKTKEYIMYLNITENPKRLNSEEWVNNMLKKFKDYPGPGGLKYEEIRRFTVNGVQAVELYSVFKYDKNTEDIYLAHNDKIYTFIFPVAKENMNIYKPIQNNRYSYLILSTFRFLD